MLREFPGKCLRNAQPTLPRFERGLLARRDGASLLYRQVVAAAPGNGHGAAGLREPHDGKPLIILARTNPFHAMPILQERFPRLHYVRFKSEDERARMNQSIARDLGIDPIRYTH